MSPEPGLTAPEPADATAAEPTTLTDPVGPPELVIFIGLQAAGKTTFYHARFAATHAHISKDLLRNNKRPERRQTQLIAEALAAGRSVVVDNTNATVADRATLIGLGRAAGAAIIGYYFPTTVGASLTRNRERTGRARVPDVAIFARARQLAPPAYGEGFDALFTVAIAGEGAFTVTRMDETVGETAQAGETPTEEAPVSEPKSGQAETRGSDG
ncbi:MAG TPA: ATP-binding protein [Ktedonobacterales bacterium]|nr:ATP-binding protein [Ktedonobacterales bacterium]